jgi:3',5'-cyclic AMP phosphodiesterase CpdA
MVSFAPMSNELEAVIVLLSDLHFGNDLYDEAKGASCHLPWWLKFKQNKINEIFRRRCTAHDMGILKRLPRYLKYLLLELGRPDFDLYLVLGDLATQPTGSSYSFLTKYLTQQAYVTGNGDSKHEIAGLNIDPKKLILIPGNHDKLLQTDLKLYQQNMLLKLGKGPEPSPRGCHLQSLSIGIRQFLFVLVEASCYAKQKDVLDLSFRDHLARGAIDEKLKLEIKRKLRRLKRGNEVDQVRLDNYDRTIRILMVHYAVDVARVLGTSSAIKSLGVPHQCDGLNDLVTDLRSHFHLVIHGHLHQSRIYDQEEVPVVAITTTTQRGGDNGFFLLKLFSNGDLLSEHHRWHQTGFLPDDRQEFNQTLITGLQ